MTVRVAAIDSGVNSAHPHIGRIAGGVYITARGIESDYTDYVGHGTAVAAAIQEKAPEADFFAVKVFDRQLSTSGEILLRALDWCLDAGMDLINLSLGTRNAKYKDAFAQRIERAAQLAITIVAAYEMNGEPAYPGSLAGVAPVLLDPSCPRDSFVEREVSGRLVFAAPGFPRSIPGVSPQRNLQGISFAVANVTGLLAAQRAQLPCT